MKKILTLFIGILAGISVLPQNSEWIFSINENTNLPVIDIHYMAVGGNA